MIRILSVACAIAYAVAAQPVTLNLIPTGAGGRSGKVAVSVTADGLLITGSIAGGPPTFASAPEEMPTADHVEVWIAPETPPILPLGWGNQHGMETGRTEKDCAQLANNRLDEVKPCIEWFRAMPRYRVRFRRLFLRQYQLAPGVAVESFAAPAFDEIAARFPARNVERLKPLRPSTMPTLQARPTDTGYDFDVQIPWTALPPVNSLVFDKLRIGPLLWLSPFGSGQCGSCSRAELRILRIEADGRQTLVWAGGGRIGDIGLADMDIHLSADWRRITVYRLAEYGTETWSSEVHCLKGDTYVKCGASAKTTPPVPRVLKLPW